MLPDWVVRRSLRVSADERVSSLERGLERESLKTLMLAGVQRRVCEVKVAEMPPYSP